MEVAYNAKEQQACNLSFSQLEQKSFLDVNVCERFTHSLRIQVEAELGTMREQLSSELRRAVGGSSEKADARALLTDSERGSMRN